MSDCKSIARVSLCASLCVWNTRTWHRCKADTWKRCPTGRSDLAQSEKCGFDMCVCTPRHAGPLGMILWTSYSRLCLSKSKSDCLGPENQGSFFYCQWWRCRGTYAGRYSSFLESPKNALRDGPTLKTRLLIPHGSRLYMWNKLCLVLRMFTGYIPVLPSVQPALARKPCLLLRHVFSF